MTQLVKINKSQVPAKLEDIQKFILIGRAVLKAHLAKIRALDQIGETFAAKSAALADAQDLTEALIAAESKLGEMLAKIERKPKREHGSEGGTIPSLPSGINKKQSHFAQAIASRKDVAERVMSQARSEKRIATPEEVYREIKIDQRDQRINDERTKRVDDISGIDIRHGDFKKVLSDVQDIDAIITDPPYPKEYIQCFSDLSLFASEHLKDNGFLISYSGQYNLPEVIQRLSEHMTYVWTFCLYHVGKKQLVNGVNIMCGWKPVLIFSKGNKKMRFSAYDVLTSEAMEKHSHEWQQSESGVRQLIEIFSSPGELVCDPFAGSGTFLKVANGMNRNTIGAEIDKTKK